ncbi:S9 family peptidase [Thiohalorhabdus sp. Cl-TMA]|uniref:Prolyl oligopeptidase family serine peptidase n=1 Tax=Thiohalorhabdus methylotrophus TaxID=3242694 RepID=A0ABV4TVF1_9GAMM
MSARTTAPYGTWTSPVTPDRVAASSRTLLEVFRDRGSIYWLERRPEEGGRNALVRLGEDGTPRDVLPEPFEARSRVHEYGGAAALVHDRYIYFVNGTDQRIYRKAPEGAPEPLTPAGSHRFADGVLDPVRERSIWVLEDHAPEGEPRNALAAVPLSGGHPEVLVSGRDFFAFPRISPDGRRLAWVTWDHPRMPWNGSELWVADLLPGGSAGAPTRVAGGPDESVFQPEWSPEGNLYFVSDRSGWWNLYRLGREGPEPLTDMRAEIGKPLIQLGTRTYAIDSAERIVFTYVEEGRWHLATLEPGSRALHELDTGYAAYTALTAGDGEALVIAASTAAPPELARVDLETGGRETLARSLSEPLDPAYLSEPIHVAFPTRDGQTAYGFFYAPGNADYEAPSGDLPPLLVKCHGGPTNAATPAFDWDTQFWTSRGFAVLDVNYRGSSGYGRAYREQLLESWGVLDVDDCVDGARWLADKGLANGERRAIRGRSAGGYTVLSALTFREAFRAGASYYGISDLERLAAETHKFESHYLEQLIGSYPDARHRYRERSPINAPERLDCPVIFFQGLKDKVVPPNQAETMVRALRDKGITAEYHTFEDEGHGFHKAGNMKACLLAELAFYARVFGLAAENPA